MPRPIWAGRDTRDALLDALSLALADDNARLRAQYPDVFAKAAAVKAARTRAPAAGIHRELSTDRRAVAQRRRNAKARAAT
jgi:hypothetical protein